MAFLCWVLMLGLSLLREDQTETRAELTGEQRVRPPLTERPHCSQEEGEDSGQRLVAAEEAPGH